MGNPWMAHVRTVKNRNRGMRFKDVLKLAARSYRKQNKSQRRRRRRQRGGAGGPQEPLEGKPPEPAGAGGDPAGEGEGGAGALEEGARSSPRRWRSCRAAGTRWRCST